MRWLVPLLLAAACYAHTPVKPCTNVMNCNNPADSPPLTDSKNPDAGR